MNGIEVSQLKLFTLSRRYIVPLLVMAILTVGPAMGSTDYSPNLDASQVVVNPELGQEHSQVTVESINLDWYQGYIDRAGAWEITEGSENITVAIIDTGVVFQNQIPFSSRWENPAEMNGVGGVDDDNNGFIDDFYGWDFTDGDNDPESDSSGNSSDNWYHATMLASLMVGTNGMGIAPNIKIMNIRVVPIGDFACATNACLTNAVAGLRYAAMMNATVVNISGGGLNERDSYREALTEVTSKNIPAVAAAGNEGSGNGAILYPAKYPDTIAVSGIGQSGALWSRSSYGSQIDVSAPAENILGIDQEGNNRVLPGTSWAAGITSAVVALMLSTRSDLNTSLVKAVLSATATDLGAVGKDRQFGHGAVNASAAVRGWLNFESTDFDGDGMNTSYELEIGLNPFSIDTDGGGIDDIWELENGWDPLDSSDDLGDFDDDGLTNGQEYQAGTDMNLADTDSDGLPDKYEVDNGLDPLTDDSADDRDDDGLSNLEEYEAGTLPNKADTDNDGMTDGYEIDNGLDPFTDDADEDLDDDDLSNFLEFQYGTRADLEDTDADGMPDKYELIQDFDPLDPTDAALDLDGDGFSNLAEYEAGTDPDDSEDFPEVSSTEEESPISMITVFMSIMFVGILRNRKKY